MDVSPEYVKMCEKAKEIQLLRGHGVQKRAIDLYPELYTNGVLNIATKDIPKIPDAQYGWCDGDYYSTEDLVDYWCSNCNVEYGGIETTSYIWLPRQDQLQEMVETQNAFILGVDCNCQKEWSLIGKFYYEARKAWRYYRDFTSMEQLWLAFVMKEKYGKAWNGEDWE